MRRADDQRPRELPGALTGSPPPREPPHRQTATLPPVCGSPGVQGQHGAGATDWAPNRGIAGGRVPPRSVSALTKGVRKRALTVTDCNRNWSGLQSTEIWDRIICVSILPFKTGFCATETAISGTGLQSRRPGPHYMQLPRITVLDLSLCEGRRRRLWRTPWRRCCFIHF